MSHIVVAFHKDLCLWSVIVLIWNQNNYSKRSILFGFALIRENIYMWYLPHSAKHSWDTLVVKHSWQWRLLSSESRVDSGQEQSSPRIWIKLVWLTCVRLKKKHQFYLRNIRTGIDRCENKLYVWWYLDFSSSISALASRIQLRAPVQNSCILFDSAPPTLNQKHSVYPRHTAVWYPKAQNFSLCCIAIAWHVAKYLEAGIWQSICLFLLRVVCPSLSHNTASVVLPQSRLESGLCAIAGHLRSETDESGYD